MPLSFVIILLSLFKIIKFRLDVFALKGRSVFRNYSFLGSTSHRFLNGNGYYAWVIHSCKARMAYQWLYIFTDALISITLVINIWIHQTLPSMSLKISHTDPSNFFLHWVHCSSDRTTVITGRGDWSLFNPALNYVRLLTYLDLIGLDCLYSPLNWPEMVFAVSN